MEAENINTPQNPALQQGAVLRRFVMEYKRIIGQYEFEEIEAEDEADAKNKLCRKHDFKLVRWRVDHEIL